VSKKGAQAWRTREKSDCAALGVMAKGQQNWCVCEHCERLQGQGWTGSIPTCTYPYPLLQQLLEEACGLLCALSTLV